MNSYVCPRCNTKGPVKLLANQVCKNCQSARVWSRFGESNQVIVVRPEAEDPSAANVPAAPPPGVGRASWAFLTLSLALTASVTVVLAYFFGKSPRTLPAEQLLSRFNTLATCAVILGALALAVSIGALYRVRQRGDGGKPVRVAGTAFTCLAAGVFATAFFCWAKTERVYALPPVQSVPDGSLPQRLHNATAVVQTVNSRADRYRATKSAGVIIGAKSGRMWILTVSRADEDTSRDLLRSDALWVNLSDGRSLPGRVRWAARPEVNLTIIEVDADDPPGQVQFHPLAEAIIPSSEVVFVPNPLYEGWKLTRGTVLKRRGPRSDAGWNSLVDVDVNPRREDIGSGIYDENGRLLGLDVGFNQLDGTGEFVIISPDVVRQITAAETSSDLDAPEASSLSGSKP